MSKDSQNFWRTWNNKVCDKKAVTRCIEGSFDEQTITAKFKDHFMRLFSGKSEGQDRKSELEFRKELIYLRNIMTV